MSAIDERVVQMTFENHLFERNVATSIGTLEKLKGALNFNHALDSFNSLETNIRKADFSPLAAAVNSMSDGFSAMEVVGMTALGNITTAAMNVGTNIVRHVISPLTSALNQIKSGGWARATNLAQAQFLIEGLDIKWDEIKPDIQKSVDQTAYGLDAAAQAAAKLAASGLQYGGEESEMYKALRGIAGLAGMTSQSFERVAYVYSQIAAAGRLMSQDMLQLNALGINIAAQLGKKMGKTEQEIREMIKKGEIDFNTFSEKMYEAFGEQAGKANETFTGSLSNMRAALSRIGEKFATPYQKSMTDIYNSLREMINNINKRLDPVYSKFTKFAEKASRFVVRFVNNLDLSFIDGIVARFEKFFNVFDDVFDTAVRAVDTLGNKTKDVGDIFDRTGDKAKTVGDRIKTFTQSTKSFDTINKNLDKASDTPLIILENVNTGVTKNVTAIEAAKTAYEELKTSAQNSTPIQNLVTIINGIGAAFDILKKVFDGITDSIGGPIGTVADKLLEIGASIADLVIQFDNEFKVSEMFGINTEEVEKFTETTDNAIDTVKDLQEIVQSVIRGDYLNAPERFDLLEEAGFNPYEVQNAVNEALGNSFRYTTEVEEANERLAKSTGETGKAVADTAEETNTLTEASQDAASGINNLLTPIKDLSTAGKISEMLRGVAAGVNMCKSLVMTFLDAVKGPLTRILSSVGNMFLNFSAHVGRAFSTIGAYFEEIGLYEKIGGVLKTVFDTVADVVEKATSVGNTLIEAFFKKIGELPAFIEEVKGKAAEFFEIFKQTEGYQRLKTFIDDLKSTISSLKDTVVGKAIDIFNKFNDTTLSLKDIKFFSKTGVVMDLDYFARALSDKVIWVLDKLEGFKANILEFFDVENGGKGFFDAVSDLFESIKSFDILDAITSALKGFWDFLEMIFVPRTVSASTLYDEVAAPLDDIEEKTTGFAGVIKSLADFTKGLTDGSKSLGDVFDGLKNIVTRFLTWLNPAFDGSLDSIKRIFKDFELLFLDFNLAGLVLRVIKGIKKGGIKKAIEGIFDEVKGTVTGLKNITTTTIPNAINKISKSVAKNNTATALLKLAGAVLALAVAFKLLSTISWKQFWVAAAAIGVITVALMGLMWALGKLTNKSGGSKSTGVGSALDGILDPFKDSISKFLKSVGKGAMLVSFGVAIGLIIKALTTLSGVDWGAFFKGAVALGVVMAELAGGLWLVEKAIGKSKATVRQALVLVAYGLAIKMAASAFVALGKMDEGAIKNASKVMLALSGAMAGVMWASGKGKWSTLLTLAGIILEVTAALLVLCAIPSSMLNKSVKAITKVFNSFALFNTSNVFLKKGTKDEMAEGIIGIAGLLGEIVLMFSLAKNLDPNHMEKMGEAISKIMYSLSAAMVAVGILGRLTGGSIGMGAKAAVTGAIILGIVGVVVAISAGISKAFPGLNEFLQSGLPLLETIGEALGSVVAGFIYPIKNILSGETFSDKLESFKTFITDLVEVFSGDFTFNTAAVDSMKDLLLAIAGAELINSISEFINGVLDLFQGESLADKLGKYKEFLSTMAEIFKPGELTYDTEAVSTFANLIGEFGKAELANSITNLVNLLNPFQSFTPSVGENLVAFAGTVKDYANAIDGLKTSAVTETAAAVDIVLDFTNRLPATGGLLQAFTGEGNFGESSQGLVKFGKKMKEYSEAIDGMNVSAVEDTKNAVDIVLALCEKTPNYNGWIQSVFGEKDLDSTSSGLVKFGSKMKEYSEAIDGMKTDVVTNTEDAVKSVIEIANAVPNTGGLLGMIVGNSDIGDFGEGLTTFGEDMVAYANALDGVDFSGARQANAILKTLNDAFLEIEDNFFLSNFNYDTKADELVKGVMNIFTKFSYELGNGTSYADLEDAGKNLFDKVLNGFYSKCTDPKQSAEIESHLSELLTNAVVGEGVASDGETSSNSFLDGAKSELEENKDYLNPSIRLVFGELSDTIEDEKSNISTATKTAMSGATDSINSMVSAFETSGTNLMRGLADGIKKSRTLPISAIGGVAMAVLTKTNETFGIKSPSRETFKTATYFIQGFVNGIAQNKHYAVNATESLASDSLLGMNRELENYNSSSSIVLNDFVNTLTATWLYIKSLTEETLDSQPTISPVLDLTNVQRGASGIGTMLSGYSLDPTGLNMLRTSMTPTQDMNVRTDGVTPQEFAASMRGVRDDIRLLGDSISKMQILMNTGQVVGAISPGVDRRLGNIQKYNMRWA